MLPNVNNNLDDNDMNAINATIDAVRKMGNSIQSLVANGQLTPKQYAELIQAVNGLVSKGNVSVSDINKNKGLIDQSYLSEELLQQMAGNAPINSVPADGSVTSSKIADSSINNRKLIDKSIYGSKFVDGSIYAEQLADGSVTREKIEDGAINSTKIREKGIYGPRIADGAIRDEHINLNAAFTKERKFVTVIKTEDNMKIFVPGRGNKFICHEMQYWDLPLTIGVRRSNVKAWAIAKVSQYYYDIGRFNEDESKIFIYTNNDATSMETIFKLQGEEDYSGAFHHGDEISDFCKIFIGNEDITNQTGTFVGESLDMIQHTQLYEDTFTVKKLTEPYLKVKKHHRFDWEDVYTLNHEVEFVKTVTPNFSCLGALTLRRNMQDGTPDNFTDCLDLTHMRHVDIRKEEDPDSGVRSHFFDEEDRVRKLKVVGLNKDVTITLESPNERFRAFLSNHNPVNAKIYTEIVPPNIEVEAGEKFSASANFKWVTY